MKKILISILSICLTVCGKSQGSTAAPVISMKALGPGSVQFSATLRPLCPMAGRKAFYTFFYEFGDGTFSYEASPVHYYKSPGTYRVALSVTNNYDNCPTPLIARQTFVVSGTSSPSSNLKPKFFSSENRRIELKLSRDPKPGDELIAYLGYRSRDQNNASGSVVLFYNDHQYYQKSFRLTDQRAYNQEATGNSPPGRAGSANDMFRSIQVNYLDYVVLRYNGLQRGGENFVFFSMTMSPQMKARIDQSITFTAMLVPDNPSLTQETFELRVKVVASHDPNQLILRESLIDGYRRRQKVLNYKVKFQNIGEGPAHDIRIGVNLPRPLQIAALSIRNTRPVLLPCDRSGNGGRSCIDTIRRNDSLYFIIKNVYLSGTRQKGVTDEDTTKGFIEYSFKLKKRLKRRPFSSRASIVFDQNKADLTNAATGRFVKIQGVLAGYDFSLSRGAFSSKGPIRVGYTISPNTAAKIYFQLEAYVALLQREDSSGSDLKPSVPATVLPRPFVIDTARRETTLSRKRNLFQLVPLHLRYHVNNWMGVGIGVMGQISFSEENTLKDNYFLKVRRNSSFPQRFDTTISRSQEIDYPGTNDLLSAANWSSFADIQFGRIRTGIVFGLRYYRQWKGYTPDRFFVYTGFRF